MELERVEALLNRTREELERADTKASILLAAVGVVIGALTSALLANSWSPNDMNNAIEWLWWVGTALAGVGIFELARAVYPRVAAKGQRPAGVGYFGDVLRIINSDPNSAALPSQRVRQAMNNVAVDEVGVLIDQLVQTSIIVGSKYRSIRNALQAFAASSTSVLLSLLFSGFLN